jgi:putative thioredoxin
MTQQPFSRPGAVDLSGLTRPAPSGGATAGGGPAPTGSTEAGSAAGTAAYAVDVSEQNFQTVLDASVTAPVVLVFYSPTRSPESVSMAEDAATAAGEYDGRFLAGLTDIDASPTIAQAMQIPQVPLLLVILDGRPAAQPIPGVLTLDELRTLFNQLGQGLTAQGITGRHQPLQAPAPEAGEPGNEAAEQVDTRYAAAQQALQDDDVDGAVAEYQRLVDANPADTEAAAGLAMATLLQRTQGVDDAAARATADASPDDVPAQTMVADLDLLGGQVDDAIDRLVELVRRTSGDERNRAREHLLGIFAAIGNDDPRVLRGRQNLASALF